MFLKKRLCEGCAVVIKEDGKKGVKKSEDAELNTIAKHPSIQ